MNRAVLVAAAVLTLGATSAAAPAPQTRAARLAQFIQECEAKLRTARDPAPFRAPARRPGPAGLL